MFCAMGEGRLSSLWDPYSRHIGIGSLRIFIVIMVIVASSDTIVGMYRVTGIFALL